MITREDIKPGLTFSVSNKHEYIIVEITSRKMLYIRCLNDNFTVTFEWVNVADAVNIFNTNSNFKLLDLYEQPLNYVEEL